MTAYEEWLVRLVTALIGDAPTEALVTAGDQDRSEVWRKLAQRFAIGLTQARALECRHLAAEVAINFAGSPLAGKLAEQCWDRSHKLEAIGMQLAQEYPPVDGREVMVCRCVIDHAEMKVAERLPRNPGDPLPSDGGTVQGYFVCSHCRLPKRGAAVSGPMVVQ